MSGLAGCWKIGLSVSGAGWPGDGGTVWTGDGCWQSQGCRVMGGGGVGGWAGGMAGQVSVD